MIVNGEQHQFPRWWKYGCSRVLLWPNHLTSCDDKFLSLVSCVWLLLFFFFSFSWSEKNSSRDNSMFQLFPTLTDRIDEWNNYKLRIDPKNMVVFEHATPSIARKKATVRQFYEQVFQVCHSSSSDLLLRDLLPSKQSSDPSPNRSLVNKDSIEVSALLWIFL